MPYLDSLVARGIISPDALDGLLQNVANVPRVPGQPPVMGPEVEARGGARTYTGASGDPVIAPDYGAEARAGDSATTGSRSIEEMRGSGMTWQQIGDELGISRQAAHQRGAARGLTGAAPDEPSNALGNYATPPGAPMKWTREYGMPGDRKWRAAFGRLNQENRPWGQEISGDRYEQIIDGRNAGKDIDTIAAETGLSSRSVLKVFNYDDLLARRR